MTSRDRRAAVRPPRVIDRVVVGDAPEGFAISPKGDVAVALLLGGAIVPKSMWFNSKRNDGTWPCSRSTARRSRR